jgi:hypothetical protein
MPPQSASDRDLDGPTAHRIAKIRDPNSLEILDTIILVANSSGDKKLIDPEAVDLSQLLEENPELDRFVREASISGSFKNVRDHPALQVKAPFNDSGMVRASSSPIDSHRYPEEDVSDQVVLSCEQENGEFMPLFVLSTESS